MKFNMEEPSTWLPSPVVRYWLSKVVGTHSLTRSCRLNANVCQPPKEDNGMNANTLRQQPVQQEAYNGSSSAIMEQPIVMQR